MEIRFESHDEIDTWKIEEFLLGHDGVVNATVWSKNKTVLARVTVTENSGLDELHLRKACEAELGPKLTPNMILLERALRPAA